MQVEYDPVRDLLYIYFTKPGSKASKTETIVPGLHVDFDKQGKLMGIEVIDASEIVGSKIEFSLPQLSSSIKKTAHPSS